ncbi:MAG: phage tail protein [Neisseria sp.]|nr:phage tail protein [Neisseria sp.]
MTQQYFTLITRQGAAKLARAAAMGTRLNLTEMAVGDGGGKAVTPSENAAALTREVYRGGINHLETDPDNAAQIIAELLIAEDTGNFTVREVGLFDEAGDLIAVGNLPDTYKPVAASGSARSQLIRMVIHIGNAANVTLKIDPSVIIATRDFVENSVAKAAFPVSSTAELRRLNQPKARAVILAGYHAGSTLGGGIFVADPSDKTTRDNGGTVIVDAAGTRWKRLDKHITPFHFGAKGDGQTDDTAAFRALEAVVKRADIDLCGGTFAVSALPSANRYSNGRWKRQGRFQTAGAPLYGTAWPVSAGAGVLFDELKTASPATNQASVLQSIVYDGHAGIYYATGVKSGTLTDGQERVVLSAFTRRDGAVSEAAATSLPSNKIGHQGLALERTDGGIKLWAACGSYKYPDNGNFAVRFDPPQDGEDIGQVQEFRLWNSSRDNVRNYISNTVSISPDGRLMAVMGLWDANKQARVRIFEMGVFSDGPGDYSDKWLHTWDMPDAYNGSSKPLQSLAVDGQFVYVLMGEDEIQVFTHDGVRVGSHRHRIGRSDLKALAGRGHTDYYEPESWVWLPVNGGYALGMSVVGGYKGSEGAWNEDAARYCNRIYTAEAIRLTTGLGQPLATCGRISAVNPGNPEIGVHLQDSGVIGRQLVKIWSHTKGVNYGGAIEMYGNEDSTNAKGVINFYAGNSNISVQLTKEYASFQPTSQANGKIKLGNSWALWSQVYAQTGSIHTSDRREKQDIGEIPEAVIAAWREVPLIQYRWREAVAEKHAGARYHTGLIAQSIKETFEAHGLDAQDYGLLCYDQWAETPEQPAVYNEDGDLLEAAAAYRPAGERWGIRAEECLFIEAESHRRQIADLTARIEKLEGAKRRRKAAEEAEDGV